MELNGIGDVAARMFNKVSSSGRLAAPSTCGPTRHVSLTATQPDNPSSQQVKQDVAGVIVQGGINYKF